MSITEKSLTAAIWRCAMVVILAIAFGYIEAAVVVYLRQIFHPAGFSFPFVSFPLTAKSRSMVFVEVGREAATLVLIFCAAFLSGHNRRQRLAYFLIIFAVWDIFYYVWLKVLLGWPGSVMDWDVLFLIPFPWAGPVLAPVLVSLMVLVLAGMILYRDFYNPSSPKGFAEASTPRFKVSLLDSVGFTFAGLLIVVSFCIAGKYMQSADYASHFSWPVFLAGLLAAGVVSAKCVCKK
ncbi:MAG: hypothetical protein ABSB91_01930 [Sedimentisphaerales bacterium]|jgi:hypothetical protein